MMIDRGVITVDNSLKISVNVKKTGGRAGKEIVQLYLRDNIATVTPSQQKLKRFVKIALEPGQEKTVIFTLGPDDYKFIGRDNKPVVEPGEFTVMIGDLKQNFIIR